MKIWTSLDQVPGDQRSVVTIGNFDGVHRGHTRVLDACVQRAHKLGLDAVALTFDPHPRTVHNPDSPVPQLMTLDDRLEAMAVTGLDATFVAHYDRELYSLSADEFVTLYLVERLGAQEVVVGEDFRFGHGNSGNISTLRELGAQLGFDVLMVADIEDVRGRRWSSSWARELLAAGEVEAAADVLGRATRITGTVVHGKKRGRKLGFPTANVRPNPGVLVPADGVYAGWLVRDVQDGQEFLPSAISIGVNPQFGGDERTIEAHVLGRTNLDLYGDEVSIIFVRRLRPTLKFDSVDDLLAQMDRDILATAATLGARRASRVDPLEVTAGE